MTDDELMERLAAVVARRKEVAQAAEQLDAEEKALIAEAWRKGIGPTRIATVAERSDAHIRKLRPDDVPPLRLGGGAAKAARKRTGQAKR